MGKIITFKISGRGVGTDAPTVEDWLDQIRDYLEILRGVEEAISEDGQNAIEWRVVNASKNTPLAIQVEAYARQYAVNIDRRAAAVVKRTAAGLHDLQRKPERPPFFTDKVLAKAVKTFERATNGLDVSEVDFGDVAPPLTLTQSGARSSAKNAQLALKPVDRPYNELAAIEGFVSSVERDGFGHKILWIRHRLTGNQVKCLLEGEALTTISQHEIDEIFRGQRVLVSGTVHYKAIGHISQVHATGVRFFAPRAELPTVDDILDENFTGGLSSEEYLAKLRDGQLS